MVAMKKFQVNIEQDHAKTEEPLRYAKRNTMQVTFKFKKNLDLDLKKKSKSSNDGTDANNATVKSNCAGVD